MRKILIPKRTKISTRKEMKMLLYSINNTHKILIKLTYLLKIYNIITLQRWKHEVIYYKNAKFSTSKK